MIFNIVLFFIVPWLFGIWLYKKDSRLFLTTYPFSCLLALTIDTIGTSLGFWHIYPFDLGYISSILLSLGLYPITGTFFIYLFYSRRVSIFALIILFSLISTVFKAILLSTGRVVYANGWNIYLSFITFLVSYFIGYSFYKALYRRNILV